MVKKSENLEITNKIKALLWSEENWTQGEMACDESGFNTSPNSERACRWCWTGALIRATNSTDIYDIKIYMYAVAVCQALGWEYTLPEFAVKKLILFNDTITEHAELVHTLDTLLERFDD
jgi:hypothetical protein